MYFISHIRYCIVLFEFIIRIYFQLSFDTYCPNEWGVHPEGCQKNTRCLLMILACAAQAEIGLLPRILCHELSSFPFFIGCRGPQKRKIFSGIGKQLSFLADGPRALPEVLGFFILWRSGHGRRFTDHAANPMTKVRFNPGTFFTALRRYMNFRNVCTYLIAT